VPTRSSFPTRPRRHFVLSPSSSAYSVRCSLLHLPFLLSLTIPRCFSTRVLHCKEDIWLHHRWSVTRPPTIFPKAPNHPPSRPRPYFLAPPSRWILLATFIDSWIFIFSSALMISGVGLSFNQETCRGAIFLCIVFYASSKVLVYIFLGQFSFPLYSLTQ
jgi:hypothetical protein